MAAPRACASFRTAPGTHLPLLIPWRGAVVASVGAATDAAADSAAGVLAGADLGAAFNTRRVLPLPLTEEVLRTCDIRLLFT